LRQITGICPYLSKAARTIFRRVSFRKSVEPVERRIYNLSTAYRRIMRRAAAQ
jgi:hypothetical protein